MSRAVLFLLLASGVLAASGAARAQDAFTFAQPGDCAYIACGDGGPCYLDPREVSAPEALRLLAEPAPPHRAEDLADRVAASGDTAFVAPLLALAGSQAGMGGELDETIRRQDRAFYALRAASGLGAARDSLLRRGLDARRPVVAAAAIRALALDPIESERDSIRSAFRSQAPDDSASGGSPVTPEARLVTAALAHYTASLLARERYASLRSVRGRMDYLLWSRREGWRIHALRDLHAESRRRVDLAILSYQPGTAGSGGPPAPSRSLACPQTETEAYARERLALHLLLEAPPSLVPPFRAPEEASGDES